MTMQNLSSRRPSRVHSIDGSLLEIEVPLDRAAYLATALFMAIGGMNRGEDPEHEKIALEQLANEVKYAAHEALERLNKMSNPSRGEAA